MIKAIFKEYVMPSNPLTQTLQTCNGKFRQISIICLSFSLKNFILGNFDMDFHSFEDFGVDFHSFGILTWNFIPAEILAYISILGMDF